MNVIVGGRQSGRTEKLIHLAAEAEARGEVSYIVCSSQAEATRIFRRAAALKLSIGFPLTYDEFLSETWSPRIFNFYIDNADELLQHISRGRVAAVVLHDFQLQS